MAWFPAFYGDIDLLIRPDEEDAASVVSAVREFGFASLGLTADDLSQPGKIIQLGMQPNRFNLITSVSGVTFEKGWANRLPGLLDGVPVSFIALEDLTQNKQSAGRPKDLIDVDALLKRRPIH